jgi:DNA-binding transcriptional MerR regulator
MRNQLIGTVAAELGVNPRTLRYYESLGLLPAPKRSASGYRLYDGRTAQRLCFISNAKRLGLRLSEIRDILKVWEGGRQPCRSVQRVLLQHVEQIDRQVRELRTLRGDLMSSLRNWQGVSDQNGMVCPRIERYNTRGGPNQ